MPKSEFVLVKKCCNNFCITREDIFMCADIIVAVALVSALHLLNVSCLQISQFCAQQGLDAKAPSWTPAREKKSHLLDTCQNLSLSL